MSVEDIAGIYSPPQVDRIWLWVFLDSIPIYPILYLLKGDYICNHRDEYTSLPSPEP